MLGSHYPWEISISSLIIQDEELKINVIVNCMFRELISHKFEIF